MVSKEKLIELVNNGYSRKQVSEELGIGYSTVYKYMSKYNLTFKTKAGILKHNCNTCGETDPEQFYQSRKIQCKKCFNIECGEKLKKQKLRAVEYKGGECQHCGYKKSVAALEFHHKDPTEKDPQWRMGWSWERLQKEIDKCILLCANCHREEHERISPSGATG